MQNNVTAEDGSLRPVYSVTADGDIWCHICNAALLGVYKLLSHNSCNQHQIKLRDRSFSVMLWSKRSDDVEKNVDSNVSKFATSEPISSSIEDHMSKTTVIQITLDRHKTSPLVGLEYILELVDPEGKEPNYTCVLCDKRGDPRTFMAHIISYNHRKEYLNRHFPTISRAILDLPRTADYKRGANEISLEVSKAIEQHFGRLKPQSVDKIFFEKNRVQIIKKVYQDYHFR